VHLLSGSWVLIKHNVSGPRPTSVPSGILIHPAIWPQQIWAKNWGLRPFWEGGAGSLPNTMWLGTRPTCNFCMPSFIWIHPVIWPQQIWAENCAETPPRFGGGGVGSPSNKLWPGPRPACLPTFVLLDPSSRFFHNTPMSQTDRTRQTDNGLIA